MASGRQRTRSRLALITGACVLVAVLTALLFVVLLRTGSYTTSWGERIARHETYVSIDGETLTQEDLAYIAGLRRLRSLELTNCNVAECRLRELSFASKDLYRVNLSGTKGLWDLSFLGTLAAETLDLSGCAGVEDISALNWEVLYDLDVSDTDVTSLAPAAGSDLRYLHFAHTDVSEIAPLAEARHLYEVDGSYTQVSDLVPLTGLQSLMRISFEGCPIRTIDGTFSHGHLREVRLADTKIGDLACLQDCHALTVLDVHGCRRLRGNGWLDPLWCQSLEELYLGATRITADDLGWLGECQGLEVLELDGIALGTLDVCRGLGSLERLSALGCGLTDVTGIKGCAELETVLLGYNELGDGSLAGLPAPQTEWTQTVLDLSHNRLTSAQDLPGGEYRALFLQGNDDHLARTIPLDVTTRDLVADYFFGVDDSRLRDSDRFWQIYLIGVPANEKDALLEVFRPWYLSCVSEEELLDLVASDDLSYVIGDDFGRLVAFARARLGAPEPAAEEHM